MMRTAAGGRNKPLKGLEFTGIADQKMMMLCAELALVTVFDCLVKPGCHCCATDGFNAGVLNACRDRRLFREPEEAGDGQEARVGEAVDGAVLPLNASVQQCVFSRAREECHRLSPVCRAHVLEVDRLAVTWIR